MTSLLRRAPIRLEDIDTREPWGQYVYWFVAGGKPMNQADLQAALPLWLSLSAHDQQAATESAEQICRTRGPDTIPLPANHLRQQPWTRQGRRVLPPPARAAMVASNLPAVVPDEAPIECVLTDEEIAALDRERIRRVLR